MGGRGGGCSGLIDYLRPPSHTHTHPSFLTLLLPLPTFSFQRLSGGQRGPNRLFPSQWVKPQQEAGIGRPASDPKYPAITRANGTTMQEKRKKGGEGGRGGGSTKDIFIYVKENANMAREEWRGFWRLSLILLLLNSRADGRDWHGGHVKELVLFFFRCVCPFRGGCKSPSNTARKSLCLSRARARAESFNPRGETQHSVICFWLLCLSVCERMLSGIRMPPDRCVLRTHEEMRINTAILTRPHSEHIITVLRQSPSACKNGVCTVFYNGRRVLDVDAAATDPSCLHIICDLIWL